MATTVMSIKKVFFPFDEAVAKAAAQNAAADFRKGLHNSEKFADLPRLQRNQYEYEAERLLKTTGENRLPTYPENEHICVQKEDDVVQNQTR